MSIIKGILDVGAVVILPIVMLILCLIFRMPFGKSLKAGLMIGIGILRAFPRHRIPDDVCAVGSGLLPAHGRRIHDC